MNKVCSIKQQIRFHKYQQYQLQREEQSEATKQHGYCSVYTGQITRSVYTSCKTWETLRGRWFLKYPNTPIWINPRHVPTALGNCRGETVLETADTCTYFVNTEFARGWQVPISYGRLTIISLGDWHTDLNIFILNDDTIPPPKQTLDTHHECEQERHALRTFRLYHNSLVWGNRILKS